MSSAHRAERQRNARPPLRGRAFVLVALGLLGLCIVWAGFRMVSARGHLVDAQNNAETMRIAIAEGDTAASSRVLTDLQESVRSASRALNDPVLVVAAHVPIVGRNVAAPREVANVLDDVAHDSLPKLVTLAADMTPAKVMPGGGKVNLEVLKAAAPGLEQSSRSLEAALKRLDGIESGLVLPPISRGVAQVRGAIGEAADTVGTGARVARLGPPMLGENGSRKYLLVFQNNAEIRSTGGMPGAWAELNARDGVISLTKQGTASQIDEFDAPVVPLTRDEKYVFSDELVTFFSDFTFTPDWPRAAYIASRMIEKHNGMNVDGVISVDPIAVSYLMRATGPVQPEFGDTLTADNVIDTMLNGTYLKYSNSVEQDAYFAASTVAVFDAITGSTINAKALGEGISQAAKERRLLLWAEDDELQEQLAGTAVAGETRSGESDRPHIGFYLSDAASSKMQYYLSYDSKVEATECTSSGVQTYNASLTLTSSAPADAARLPASITGGTDKHAAFKPGDMTMALKIFAPHQGKVTAVTARGAAQDPSFAPFAQSRWNGRGVGETTVTLSPGQTMTLDVIIESGADSRGDAEVTLTPSSKPNKPSVYTVESAC